LADLFPACGSEAEHVDNASRWASAAAAAAATTAASPATAGDVGFANEREFARDRDGSAVGDKRFVF
jgi:hypothetical protein